MVLYEFHRNYRNVDFYHFMVTHRRRLFLGDFIFKYTDWGITKATIVHFITTYVGFLPLAILAGWFPLTINYLIIFTIIFIVVYTLIWIIQFFKTRTT